MVVASLDDQYEYYTGSLSNMVVPQYKAVPLFAPPVDGEAPLTAKENRCVNIAPDGLGESPVWDHRVQTLYWIDIVTQTLTAAYLGSATPSKSPNSGASTEVAVAWLSSILPSISRFVLPADSIGFVAPTEKQHVLVAGSNNGLFLFDTRIGKIVARGPHPERGFARHRFNDGKVGPAGRLYAGTMQMKLYATDKRDDGSGRFYRIDAFAGAEPQVVDAVGPTTVSNGLDWSPDRTAFYHVDTPTKRVCKYDFNEHSGTITNGRVLRDLGERVDGMCVDSEGHLWAAMLDRSEVHRLDHNSGETLAVVQVPGVKLVTSCCFGGPKMSLLFITTAAGTTADAVADTRKASDYISGHIFVADVGVRGQKMTPFNLEHAPKAKL
jgi:sugar lactone lactonase YvrE